MSLNLRTETIQTTISALNGDFAGRIGSPDYDATKLIHIHRRNRAFVWDDEMQVNLLDSILKGYYIPPIICCSRIVNSIERREVIEGGNRITTFRHILNGSVRQLTNEERQRVEAYGIALVVMRNLPAEHLRVMFRRLNKNVRVSDGQLYAMSLDDSPLVREANALLKDDTYPLRELITRHFFDTRKEDNAGHSNLSNAVALVSGALHGISDGTCYITKSYNVQDPMVEKQDPINRQVVVQVLGALLEVFTLADTYESQPDGRKRRGQWSIGHWLGAILYDYHTHPGETRRIQEKWARYIARVRQGKEGAEDATKIAGAQNLTANRYKRISKKVEIYMNENRLATDIELNQFVHENTEDETDDGISADD